MTEYHIYPHLDFEWRSTWKQWVLNKTWKIMCHPSLDYFRMISWGSKMILQLLSSFFVFRFSISLTLTIPLLPLISPSHAGVALPSASCHKSVTVTNSYKWVANLDTCLHLNNGASWYEIPVIWGPLGSLCVEHPSVNRDKEGKKCGDRTGWEEEGGGGWGWGLSLRWD